MTTKLSTPTERTPLPAGWRWARLGEVCDEDRVIIEPDSPVAADLPYLSLEHIESEIGRILGTGNPSEVRSTTFAFDSRHVLYGKLRPYLNKVALPDFKGRCTTELLPLLPRELCDREYLTLLLRRPETVAVAMQQKTGSRMPRADMEVLLGMRVPLPLLPEQRRIAARLNAVMAEIARARAAAQAALDAANALPAALLGAVFESDEAKGWTEKSLSDLVSHKPNVIKRGPFGSSLRKEFFVPSGYKVHEQSHAIKNDFTIGNYYINQEKFEEMRDYEVKPGDIIISCSGTIGKVAIVPSDAEPGIINQALLKLTLNPDVILQKFFKIVFESGETIQQLGGLSSGSGLKNVASVRLLKQMRFPVPSPEDQSRIVVEFETQMEKARQLRAAAQPQLDAINALPAAYLRRAFRGEL